MNNQTILIVDDEQSIREMVRMTLEREKYSVLDCETAEEAKIVLLDNTVHLTLIDWMLPHQSGVDFVKQIRTDKQLQTMPIILLTAKNDEDDKIEGFEAGIDDYISKPFSLKEMLARIRSVMRRTYGDDVSNTTIKHAGITVDDQNHLVYTENNTEIHLGPTEFKLLHFLMSKPGRVYSREQLLDNVWGVGVYVDERTIDVHIRRLRKAFANHKLENVIRTVRGRGYSFNKNI